MSYLVNILVNFPPDIATAILAMTPVGELRAAIPIGIEVFGLSPLRAFILAIIGNTVPAVVVILLLNHFTKWCACNFHWCHRRLEWMFARTEKVFAGDYKKQGIVALYLLTAIPFPFTGVWTAAVAAVLFKIPVRQALPAIILGMVTAGIIVTAVTLGAGGIIRSFIISV